MSSSQNTLPVLCPPVLIGNSLSTCQPGNDDVEDWWPAWSSAFFFTVLWVFYHDHILFLKKNLLINVQVNYLLRRTGMQGLPDDWVRGVSWKLHIDYKYYAACMIQRYASASWLPENSINSMKGEDEAMSPVLHHAKITLISIWIFNIVKFCSWKSQPKNKGKIRGMFKFLI